MPAWGRVVDPTASAWPLSRLVPVHMAQVACAIEFARSRAVEYGGDAARLVVFGHSGGGMAASVVAVDGVQPSEGCLGPRTSGAVHRLVLYEGDWILADASFDEPIGADPGVLDVLVPWGRTAGHTELWTAVLSSEQPGSSLFREETDFDWLGARDPDGWIKAWFERTGALQDGIADVSDEQRLFVDRLTAEGISTRLVVLPGSTHMHIAEDAWPAVLDTIAAAAAVG